MTSFDPGASQRAGAAPEGGAPAAPFSIAECRSCAPELKELLETLDDDVRSVLNQLLVSYEGRGESGTAFLKSATTVLLSIAATLMETAAERDRGLADIASFKDAAEDAARWAKSHKLRDFLDSEA